MRTIYTGEGDFDLISDNALRTLARRYLELEADRLEKENKGMEGEPVWLTPVIEARVASMRRKAEVRRRLAATLIAAAVLALALTAPYFFVKNAAGGDGSELLELPFDLPQGYTLVSGEVRDGRSVYTLRSERYGDIVLVMDPGAQDMQAQGEPAPYGDSVVASFTRQSRTIRFVHEDVGYTITSYGDETPLFILYRLITGT